ncbi:MAG: COG1470 family protein, partial [Planctomycetota bacterium]
DWTTSPGALWHIEGSRSHSGPSSWAFNDGTDYDTGFWEIGSLYSPWIDIGSAGSFAEFSWWEFRETENALAVYDESTVYIQADGDSGWDLLYTESMSTKNNTWEQRVFDISSYVGSPVRFRFQFDTYDSVGNAYEGWFVDDVQVLNPTEGGMWTPTPQIGYDVAGGKYTYLASLANIGTSIDTFTFSTSGTLGWTVTIYDMFWTVVTDSGPIDAASSGFSYYIDVQIPAAAPSSDTETTIVTATSSFGPTADLTLRTYILDRVLLVSDDFENGIESYYQAMLNANSFGGFYDYDWIDVNDHGLPSQDFMNAHEIVIWHTVGQGAMDYYNSVDPRSPITTEERNLLNDYLISGGYLYLASAAPLDAKLQWYVTGDISPLLFYGYEFGFEAYPNYPWPYPPWNADPVQGVDGNPIGDGLSGTNQMLLNNPVGDGHPDCLPEGTSCLWGAFFDFEVAFEENYWSDWCVGTTLDRADGTRRVFTSFDLATVDTASMRNEIMRRILTFLVPPDYGVSVDPVYQAQQGYANEILTYDLCVTNIGTSADVFDLTVTSVWFTSLYEADQVTPLSDKGGLPGVPDTGLLAPGELYNITVKVQIPNLAAQGDFDISTITATSYNGTGVVAAADIRSSVPYLILLVDDDDTINNGGSYGNDWHAEDPNFNTWYADALTALGYDFDVYVVPTMEDGPDLQTLMAHPIVIWVNGGTMSSHISLSANDQNNLATFLDNGGRLWYDAPGAMWELIGSFSYQLSVPGTFVYDYLKITSSDLDIGTPSPISGVAGSIFDGVSYPTTDRWIGGGGAIMTGIEVHGGAQGAWTDPGGPQPFSANQYTDGTYKTVFTGIEWSHITTAANRQDAMDRILNWFMPNAEPSIEPPYQEWYGTPNSFVWYNLTVVNKARLTDTIDMTATSPSGWTYDFFEADMVTPLPDTGGAPGVPDTGNLSPYSVKQIAVRVTVPIGALDGERDVGVVRATSFNSPGVWDEATLETLVYEAGLDYKSVYISSTPESDLGPVVTLLDDDMESGAGGWTHWDAISPSYNPPNGPVDFDWHIVDPDTLPDPTGGTHGSAHSSSNVWWYGDDARGDFLATNINHPSGMHHRSRLQTPWLDLTGYTSATLTFWDWYNYEEFWEPEMYLQIDTGSGFDDTHPTPVGDQIAHDPGHEEAWQETIFDLTPYVGQTIRVG